MRFLTELYWMKPEKSSRLRLEIVPQAYFSRNALRMASLLAPLLQFFAEENIKFFIKNTWRGKTR